MNHGIVLIGAGRVGANLLRHMRQRGLRVLLVVERDAAARQRISGIAGGVPVSATFPGRLPPDATHCVIAVPDASIATVGRALAAIPALPDGLIVMHCSGSLDSGVLAPLAATGCAAGCLHPMQSFTDDEMPAGTLDGIGCGIEGSEAFITGATALATALDWRPLRVDRERKALYHAANIFAGNFPVLLAEAAETLLRASAHDQEAADLSHLLPMMRAIVERLQQTAPRDALTGPAARGDRERIREHLDALAEFDPKLRDAYAAVTALLLPDA